MKRFLSLLLVSLMLAFLLVSCSNNTDTELDTTAASSQDTTAADTTEADTTRLYPTLSDEKYGGSEFMVLYYDTVARHGWSYIPNDINVEASDGEVLSDAVFNRNLKVEEHYDVNINTYYPSDSIATTLSNSIIAGDDTYALLDMSMAEIGNFFNKGLLTTIDALDVDYTQPWFDQESVSSFTICGKRAAFVSDINYFDKLSTIVTFYNSSFGEDLGIGSLYQTANEGKFTLDKMLSYASQVSADLNNDGKMDKNDAYCISCQNDGSYFLLHSAGIRTVNNDGNTLSFNLNSEQAISALEKIFDIMGNTGIYYNRQIENIDVALASDMFAKNQALFMIRPLQTLYDLRSFDAKFEILPSPKYYEDQEQYHTAVNFYSATCLCVPKGSKDYTRTSRIVEMLAAESYYTVMPALYDVVLDVKLVNSEEASNILDIAFDTRVYDIGLIWGIGNIRGTIVTSKLNGVASTVKGLTRVAEKTIDSLIETMTNYEG